MFSSVIFYISLWNEISDDITQLYHEYLKRYKTYKILRLKIIFIFFWFFLAESKKASRQSDLLTECLIKNQKNTNKRYNSRYFWNHSCSFLEFLYFIYNLFFLVCMNLFRLYIILFCSFFPEIFNKNWRPWNLCILFFFFFCGIFIWRYVFFWYPIYQIIQ